MCNIDEITGKIDESELDNLVNEDIINGGSWCAIIVSVIVATYAAAACPTSACTKQCNKK